MTYRLRSPHFGVILFRPLHALRYGASSAADVLPRSNLLQFFGEAMSSAAPDTPFLMQKIGDIASDLTVQTAVLDRFGIIVAVNEQWLRSGERTHPTLPEFGRVGESYFRNCAFADPLSPRLIRGLSQLLSGEIDRLSVVYPFDNGNEGNDVNEGNDGQKSRYLFLAFPHSDSPGHIVVMHIDVTVLVSIFATFRRESVSDDAASDRFARPTVSIADEAEQTFLALVDESSKLTQQPYSQMQRAGRLPALSKRQMDVLALMTKGMTNAEIAHELRLSLNTVKVYVSGILARLGLQSRAQVLHWALTRQWDNSED